MNMKPIAMKCNQQQYDAIKPKLKEIKGLILDERYIGPFDTYPYLINNCNGKQNDVTNTGTSHGHKYGRVVFDKWDEQIFLEYCGYKPKVTLDDPYIVRCKTREQSEQVASCVKKRNVNLSFRYDYVINHKGLLGAKHTDNNLLDVIPEEVAHLPILTFEEWKELKENKLMTKQKLTVPITDVLEIHEIACLEWKAIIAKYFARLNNDQTISFAQSEVDEMFKAATAKQLPVLERIFGKNVKEIDWDRIKTGSKVMIQYTGQHCNGINKINIPEPVDVVFYKTPHFINDRNEFKDKGAYDLYCTFHQNGKYVLFAASKNTDYITEVIEY